jgi:tetratricopeptide (TPR) repeat protein
MGVIDDRARTWRRWATPAVALATVAAHARTLGFGFTGLDDRDLIVDDHAFLARPANLARLFGRAYMHVVDPAHAYYRPLVTASYMLDAQWSAVSPWGYHATNVALYAVAAVLFGALLRRFAMPPVVATTGAVIFAVHPVLAEAVAWIPGRNDSLLAVFALGAWVALLRDAARAPAQSPAVDRALHFALFAAALLTKETALVLPVVWAAQAALLGPRPRRGDAIVYLAGWTALVVTRLLIAPGLGGHDVILPLLRGLPITVASLGKVLLPFDPTVLAVPEDLPVWPGALAALALGGATWWVPGVRRRVVVCGVLAFVLLLAPVLALPGTLVLDSRLVLPACGLLLAVAELARAAIFARGDGRPTSPTLFIALSAILAVALLAITTGYEGAFHDRRTFAREAVAGSPHSALAHFCLGQIDQMDGDDDRALAEYQTSLALAPGEVVHNNVAVLYMKGARWADAERELREELSIDPRYARAYDNLAIVLRHEGRDDESRAAQQAADRLEANE